MSTVYVNGPRPAIANSYEAVTVSSTAVALTASKYEGANVLHHTAVPFSAILAVITVEDDDIRYTVDGTTPTSTIGHKANVGDVIQIHGRQNINKFRAIRVTNDSSIRVTYYD